ncbi:hypothetical protein SPONN_1845 [uncultured Candidatus Thioglobus sp.]|nr:hypothetical protein SPONN_1845 [uncultured Candidatus Thioglobus sp.]
MKKKDESVEDHEVMITSSISDLEKMLENVEKHADDRTDSKFERFFAPALAVFGLLAFGGFWIIYSITADMNKLAAAMDPRMGQNMSSMVVSIDNLSKNVGEMNRSVNNMDKNLNSISKNMVFISDKLNHLDDISTNMRGIDSKMNVLKPMLANMQDMNKNMIGMQKSMLWIQRDISLLRSSFSKPMGVFNAIPFL